MEITISSSSTHSALSVTEESGRAAFAALRLGVARTRDISGCVVYLQLVSSKPTKHSPCHMARAATHRTPPVIKARRYISKLVK